MTQVALGFDIGTVRIGVAIGETLTGTARPVCVIPVYQRHTNWEAIARLVVEWRPDVFIVGVPRHADGSESFITRIALRFSHQLESRFQCPVALIDEWLSSWEAEQRLLEHAPPRRRAPIATDAHAAAVIVESWLHTQNP